MTLTKSAPLRSCSRAPRLTSSTPSQTLVATPARSWEGERISVGQAEIAMSSGLGKGAPGDEHPRPGNQPLPLGFPESGIRSAGIPDGGKPLIQGFLDHFEGPNHQHGGVVQPLLLHDVGIDRADMDMGIDEAGEQGLISAVDRHGLRRNLAGGTRRSSLIRSPSTTTEPLG